MNLSEWALPPLALCMPFSKRRAKPENHSQDIEIKGIYKKEKASCEA
ncbi:hypothetical protein ACFW0H_09325 [Pseudomonas sp. CR3202]